MKGHGYSRAGHESVKGNNGGQDYKISKGEGTGQPKRRSWRTGLHPLERENKDRKEIS